MNATPPDPLLHSTTYTYDANGNVLTVTDANSKVTTYAYNNRDFLTSVTDAASGVTSFAYDAVGNLTSKTNPRSKTTAYTYDNLSRLASETDPLSHVRSYSYDAGSRLTSRTDAKSQSIAYTYNDRNELTNITYPDQSFVSFAYNDAGARTQMVDSTGTTSYSYDSLYRLTSVTFPGSRTVSYGYDDAGRRTSITYPGGSNQATYVYDNANRLTTVTDWNSRAVAYAYDDAGRLTTKTLPASTEIVSSYTYDTADRLTGIAHVKDGSTTIASVSYTLDAVGNRTQRVDQAGTHTYAYDDLYQLTSVTYPGPSTTSYQFDAFGNRTSMTNSGGTTTYAYDDAERLTSVTPPGQQAISYSWDNNGDLTARGSDSFSWDYEDRMMSATVGGTTTTLAYRGDGLRHSRTTGGNATVFTWDVNAGLPVVLDDGYQYVYGAGLESMVTANGTYYYLADGLGSTMAIVDTSGVAQKSYTYDVYGKPTATGSLANEFDFAGQRTDPTGLQYLRARYYDVETGRFLSKDPLSADGSWLGQTYSYAGSAPSNATDPTGLFCLGGNKKLCNAVAGFKDTVVSSSKATAIDLAGVAQSGLDAVQECHSSDKCNAAVGLSATAVGYGVLLVPGGAAISPWILLGASAWSVSHSVPGCVAAPSAMGCSSAILDSFSTWAAFRMWTMPLPPKNAWEFMDAWEYAAQATLARAINLCLAVCPEGLDAAGLLGASSAASAAGRRHVGEKPR